MNQLVIQDGDIPLRAAIKRNDLEAVKSLLKQSANIAEQNKYGQNAFHLVALTGNREMLKLLLNTNPPAEVVNAKDEYDNTPFHFACREGDEQSALLLLKTRGANIDAQNSSGNTALHLASKDHKLNMVNFLLSQGADVNALDNNKNSPLHLAMKPGSLKFIMKLLEVPNILINLENAEGDTPLSLATQLRSLDLIQNLIAKGAIIEKFKKGKALCRAAEIDWKEGMKFLFDLHEYRGPEDPSSRMGSLDSLHFAMKKDLPALAKLFFALNDHFYNYAFYDAIKYNNLNAIKYILGNKPEFLKTCNYNSIPNKALFDAAIHCDYKIVSFLLDQGEDINIRSRDGRTLLHYAVDNKDKGFELINFLIAKGIPIDAKDNHGRIPLHNAITFESYGSMKALLQNGADISPVRLWRAGIEDLKIMKELIRYHGIDIHNFTDTINLNLHSDKHITLRAFLYSLPDNTGVKNSVNRLRKWCGKDDIKKILKTKDGILAGVNIYFNFFDSENLEDQNFVQLVLSELPKSLSYLQQILGKENREIIKLSTEIKVLVKWLSQENKSLKDGLLDEKIDKALEILCEGEEFDNRANSIRDKVKDILNDDFIGQVLPRIRESNQKIKEPIAEVIQANINKWSKVLGEHDSKTSILKLPGNKDVCSKISSFLNHDELKNFLNTIPSGTIPIVTTVEEHKDGGRATKKPKEESIFEDDTGISWNAEDYALLTGLDSDGECGNS